VRKDTRLSCFSVLQVAKSWSGPGNEANESPDGHFIQEATANVQHYHLYNYDLRCIDYKASEANLVLDMN